MPTEVQYALNQLAGTTGRDAQGAANAVISGGGRDLVAALNILGGTTGKEYLGALNAAAGTTGLGENAAAEILGLFKGTGGLYQWFDARWASGFGVALPADNTAMGTCVDLSGNGFSATQGTGAAQPKFRTGTFGAKPSWLFDGTDDYSSYQVASYYPGQTGFSTYVVFKLNSIAANNSVFTLTNTATNMMQRLNVIATTGVVTLSTRRVGADSLATHTTAHTVTTGTPYVVSCINNYTTPGTTVSLNGSVLSATPSWAAGTSDALGWMILGSTGQFLNGHLGAVLCFAGAHTTAQRQAIERALGSIFGVTVA